MTNGADQPQPIATGDLTKTPFGHLVLYLHREGLSGTLVVNRGGFETKILFRNGKAVAARPLPRGTALQDGLLELCGLSDAPYAFWSTDLLGEASGVVKGTVDPYSFVAESMRGHVREALVASVVDRYRGIRLALVPDADLRKLNLRGQEAQQVERLRRAPMTLEEFTSRPELPPEEARRLLYLLVVTGMAAPEGTELTSRSGVRAAVASEPPASHSPVPGRPPSTPAFPIPGRSSSVPAPNAGAASSSPVPLQTGRPSSSSRPAGPSSSMPAWQQLASMRAAAQRSVPPARAPTPSMAPPPVEALDDRQKLKRAEQFVERRNYEQATRVADELIRHDAANADYLALRAWILYQQFTGDKPPRPVVDAIEAVLRLDEGHARALYLKGLVLKRLGRHAEALRTFQRAVASDPQHIEAQRELRLAKMRGER
jgi:tetratricopeptide (TPR) repeat protein